MWISVLLILGITANIYANDKIVGGANTIDGDYPYIVSIRKYNKHNCGGSILNNKFILTAAHCVYKNNNNAAIFTVQYGTVDISTDKNLLPVAFITMHKQYETTGGMKNDVAILELDVEIKFGPNAQPIKLPIPFENPAFNAKAILIGWGRSSTTGPIPNNLQMVEIVLFTDEYCKSKEIYFTAESHVCAGVIGGGKGQCNADSGGPLTVDGKQFGVVSWSIKPCAGNNHPGIFTRVSQYRNWIRMISGV